ncbi:hypothetical protein ACFVXG_14165 [Kitasatospora sp. NPDC058162]|uniref:hypothetical protein n=1 Tax=Kitasatospora sp. NPDC058162 TaxID=3346362 RepID=UPI0036D7A83A
MDIRVIVDRDSVHAGDDGQRHWQEFPMQGHLTLGDLVEWLPYPRFVPTRSTWAVYQVLGAEHPSEGFPSGREAITTTAVAVIARESGELRYHLDPRTPLSTLAGETGRVLIFCRTCGNQDPDEAFAVTAAGGTPGQVRGELYRSMATLFWAAREGARLPDQRDRARAEQLGRQVDAMFKGGARARAGFRRYLQSDLNGRVTLPDYTDRPGPQQELDRTLHDLATWAQDSRIDIFTTAYHASWILREQGGRYQSALTLEGRTTAALNGDGRAWTKLAEHLDSLRGLEAQSELPELLDELTALITGRSADEIA